MTFEQELARLMRARYAENGRGPDVYDCFGFFSALMRARGMPLPEPQTPATEAERAAAINDACAHEWKPTAARFGAAVAIRIGGFVCHMGMMLDEQRFAHMNKGTGPAIERIDAPRWAQRIAGFYEPL